MAASESYPDELLYHPEHDWARIDGDEAVLGVTWFAQDALGELVHYEAPDVGSTVSKDASYGEVESVKAVSDLISPLSGEVLEVNQTGRRRARDRERGSLRRRLADPHPDVEPGRARAAALPVGRLPQGASRRARELPLAVTDADREAMLAAIGVSSVDELFRDIPAGMRFREELDVPPALAGSGAAAALRGARGEERRRRGLLPRRRHLRPLRPGGRRRGAPARRAPDRVHAVPARDEPGRAAGDLRVPDRDLRAHRHGRLERVRLRRDDGRRRRLLRREARDRAHEDRRHRGDQPAGAPGREDLRAGLRARGRRGAARGRRDRSRTGSARRPRTRRRSSSSSRTSSASWRPRPTSPPPRTTPERCRSRTSTSCRSACSRRRAPTAARWRSARASRPATR